MIVIHEQLGHGAGQVSLGQHWILFVVANRINQQARTDIYREGRRVMGQLSVIVFFAEMPFLLMAFADHPAGIAAFAPVRILINYAISLIMYGFCFTTAGWFILQAVIRKVPFYWGLVAMVIIGTSVTSLVGGLFLFLTVTVETMTRFALMSITLGCVGTLLIVEGAKGRLLSIIRKQFPDAEVYRRSQHLDETVRYEDVVMMTAQNQYTLIQREDTQELVRMTLAEIIGQMPSNHGFRIHRSHWLRADQIDRVVYRNGNPKVVDRMGNELPLSRTKVDEIRGHLSAS